MLIFLLDNPAIYFAGERGDRIDLYRCSLVKVSTMMCSKQIHSEEVRCTNHEFGTDITSFFAVSLI